MSVKSASALNIGTGYGTSGKLQATSNFSNILDTTEQIVLAVPCAKFFRSQMSLCVFFLQPGKH
jgi:hypothetical protein